MGEYLVSHPRTDFVAFTGSKDVGLRIVKLAGTTHPGQRNVKRVNPYINRKITGALVGRQPFGGFGMSDVGLKAGGPDYLLQILNPKSICENTLRRGFAPTQTI